MQDDIFLMVFYAAMVVPSLLVAKETRTRIRDLRAGIKSLVFLPLTIGALVLYVLFGMEHLASVPVLSWSWLGYNIALGPYADSGFLGVLPFVPLLFYMLIHVNYFEELYFRKSAKLVVAWAFLHVAMGVAVHVALALLPLGFFYQYLYKKRGVNHAYALHLGTNIAIIALSLMSYVVTLP